MIVIIDYNMGNVGSILNMLSKLRVEARISRAAADIVDADHLILPGVGAFDRGMHGLRHFDLIGPLTEAVMERGRPILGLCLGMQLMGEGSEEGALAGLGWFRARGKRFVFEPGRAALRVPHMGWNVARPRDVAGLFAGFDEPPRFYFAHSYHMVCDEPADTTATTNFGYDFASAIGRRNLLGTQFHPEKSHRFGMRLLANFAGM